MSVKILINGFDLQEKFGIVLEDGQLEKFKLPPTPKEPFYNEWADVSGKDYDTTSPVVYETQIFEISFLMKALDKDDYRIKEKAFLQLINVNSEFTFKLVDYALAFYLRYKGAVEWRPINVYNNGIVESRMVLKLENNHRPVPDDGGGTTINVLADNQGRLLVINNKLIQINI